MCPEQLREVVDGSNLERTMLRSGNCTAKMVKKVTASFSADSGFYSFPVLVRGKFAAGKLCIGRSQGNERPTWLNGHLIIAPSIQIYSEGAAMLYRAGKITNWMAFPISSEILQLAAQRFPGAELSLPVHGIIEALV